MYGGKRRRGRAESQVLNMQVLEDTGDGGMQEVQKFGRDRFGNLEFDI